MALQSISGAPIEYVDVSTPTTTNNNVPPWGAYGEINPDLPAGAVVIGCFVCNNSSANSALADYRVSTNSLFVYTRSAQSNYQVRLAYYVS